MPTKIVFSPPMPKDIMDECRAMVPQGYELAVVERGVGGGIEAHRDAEYFIGFARGDMGPDFYQALPKLKRVAVLLNGANPGNVMTSETVTRAAKSIGIDVVLATARSAEEFEGAFGQITRSQCEAVIVYEDPLFVAEARQLASLSERHRLPSAGFREFADAGGLLGFGINFPDVWRQAASFVDRIFKGAKPGDLPVEQPRKFDTVVNLRTARALRLTIQPKVLLRSETVIE